VTTCLLQERRLSLLTGMVSKSSKQNPSAGLSYPSDSRPEAEP